MKKFFGGLFIFLLANTFFVPESLADDACADPGLCTQPFKVQYKMAEYPVDSTVTSNHFTFCKTADDTVNWLEDPDTGFITFLNSSTDNSAYMKESYIAGETFTFYNPNDNSQYFPFAYRVNGTTYFPGGTMTLPEQTDGETLYIELITNPKLATATYSVRFLRCAEFSDVGVSPSDVPGFIFGYADPNASGTPSAIYVTHYVDGHVRGFKMYPFDNFRFDTTYLRETTTVSTNEFFTINSWYNYVLNVNPTGYLRGFLTWYGYLPAIPTTVAENLFAQYEVVDQDFSYTEFNSISSPISYMFIPFSPVNASRLSSTPTNIFTSANNGGTVGELTFAYSHIKFHPLFATPCASDTVRSCDWDAPDKMICKLDFDVLGNVTYTNECCYGFEPTDK